MINDHLDKIQDEMLKELQATEENESSKIRQLVNSLKQKKQEIEELQDNSVSIKKYASELQTFLAMKQIEEDIQKEENYIQSIVRNDIGNEIYISLSVNTFLQNYQTTIQTFGEISVLSEASTLSIQSQDCDVSEIGDTYDVVYIGDDTVAVTSGGDCHLKQINIINTQNIKAEKILNVNSSCHGGVSIDKGLIYCAGMKGIQMIRINDESILNVSSNEMSTGAYVTTLGNKLYYTNKDEDSVICCDFESETLWIFRNETVLSWPHDISVDSDGNVYVVGYDSCNVEVISPDGKQF
ncbi:unnamed protein product [Mytilus coruscus]|uniref:Uncharacterized protein n=1 Tax=Mytilus coruscus TaxID=42192 RepID=A0A6J8C2V6_MYTCO|nr:unnamed protein product [Mytilus coruscus]